MHFWQGKASRSFCEHSMLFVPLEGLASCGQFTNLSRNEGQIVHVVGEAAARRDLHFFKGRLGSGRSAGGQTVFSAA